MLMPSRSLLAVTITALAFINPVGGSATAGSTFLSARYSVDISGIAVGKAVLNLSVKDGAYTAEAYGKTLYVAKLMSSGKGGATATGRLGKKRPIPASFVLKATEEGKHNTIEMKLSGGAIRHLIADPPLTPHPMRVPIKKAHKRGVVDPLSSAIMPVPGRGTIKGTDACNRTIPIFDGRQRFDAVLRFVRTASVKGRKGSYSGPVIICQVGYRPIAGHRSNRRVNKELVQNKELFVWLAPVGHTRVLAPWRIDIGLPYGRLKIIADRFLVVQQ